MKESNIIDLVQPGEFTDHLTNILRDGAQRLIINAVEAELSSFLEEHGDKTLTDGRKRIVRHGHLPEREVQTGIGSVSVKMGRVRDRAPANHDRLQFTSAILPPYARRSKSLDVVIPILYGRYAIGLIRASGRGGEQPFCFTYCSHERRLAARLCSLAQA